MISLTECIKRVYSDDPRICAVTLHSNVGPVQVINVYMPTDYMDNDSLEAYIDTCIF